MPASSSRRRTPHKAREPLWTETSGSRYQSKDKRNEEIGKYCEQAVAAIKKNSVSKANLVPRISIFFKDLGSVDVDHTKIICMKACCGDGRAGPIPLRINFCECVLVAVASLGRGEFVL